MRLVPLKIAILASGLSKKSVPFFAVRVLLQYPAEKNLIPYKQGVI